MYTDIDLNCDTYDAVENQLENKPTRIIFKILPEPLYRLFFQPRSSDIDTVLSRRESESRTYQRLISRYQTICDGASVPLEAKPERPESSDPIINVEQFSINDSSFVITDATDEEMKTRISSIEIEIDRIEQLRVAMESLLKGDTRVYLRKNEQSQLKLALRTLKAYFQELTIRQTKIKAERFDRQLDCWQARLEELELRMAPYISYQKYELESELNEALNEFQGELIKAKQDIDRRDLPNNQIAELKQIRQRIQELISHLQGYQREYVDRLFSERVEDLENKILNLNYALTPNKAHGLPIADEPELRNQIACINQRVTGLHGSQFQNDFTEHQLSVINSLKSRLDGIEAYINAKTAFDTRIGSVESKVSSLQDFSSPYLNYEEYLTCSARSRIKQLIKTAYSAIQTVRNGVDIDRLSSPDQEKFTENVEIVAKIEACLDGYNETFIRYERDRYEHLFSDIGPNNLHLTPEQQRAVIQNGIYNQVIAAAGTGKTLTLTTRVAYLIESQNVDPSDILVVAFTNEASGEMKSRLSDHFGITDVRIETVHAFGSQTIKSAVSGNVNSFDKSQTRNFVDRIIQTARSENEGKFISHYYNFLLHFDNIYFDKADFETKEAYIQARVEQQYQTLKGEEVRSRAEKQIADFLFIHQIDYRYEDIATWAESSDKKGPYKPDFHLPEYNLYIEHLGVNLAGEVAPWFSWSTAEYHEKIRWARDQFAATESKLVETYEFQHESGSLDNSLQALLEFHDIELNRMQFEDLVESAYDYNQREGWIKRKFVDFIQNAKRFGIKPDNIEKQLNPDNPRQFHFAHCGIILLQRYQTFLIENNYIDFSDMITRSLELIKENRDQYRSRYDHVLVDEFQDIGKGKMELIREFVGPESARLFAVGDDWQSIFSFQGAVVDYFLNFDEHFGAPTQTTLIKNFRSPPQLIEAGNALIQTNVEQMEKEVLPTVTRDMAPLVHTLQGYNSHDYVHRSSRYAATLVQEYLRKGADPDDIMVLCRFDGAVPYLDEIKSILREAGIPYTGKSDEYHGEQNGLHGAVSVYSVYQSKGREADHVILVHASEGPFGFPPAGRENELLEPVKPVDGNNVAEERRVFYVAISRTERTLDILTQKNNESRFLDEIEDFTEVVDQSNSIEPLDDVGSEMKITAKVDHLFDDIHEKKHQDGYLIDQYGGSARFISWMSNEPPTLVKNEWYQFKGVKVDKFKDQKELVVTQRCSIERLDSPPGQISPFASDHPENSNRSLANLESSNKSKYATSHTQFLKGENNLDNFSGSSDRNVHQKALPSIECDSHTYWHLVAISDL